MCDHHLLNISFYVENIRLSPVMTTFDFPNQMFYVVLPACTNFGCVSVKDGPSSFDPIKFAQI
jgi:hypothetical protein